MANALFRSQLASYASVHRDWRNKATHFVGIVMGLIMAVTWYAAEAFAGALGSAQAVWIAFIALFVGGWVLQFLGHHYEGKRPALMDNIFQAFIGPMFLVAEAMVVTGQRRDLAEAMGEGDVTAR